MHSKGNLAYGGAWEGCISYVNDLIDDLVQPTLEVVNVTEAVSRGMCNVIFRVPLIETQ